MEETKKWVRIVSKFNELTQEGQLSWTRLDPPPGLRDSNTIVEAVYVSEVRLKEIYQRVRIYEGKYRTYDNDFGSYWANEVVLEFIDEEGRSEWQFPEIPGIWDLLESVKYQVTDVDSFLEEFDEVFGEKEKSEE